MELKVVKRHQIGKVNGAGGHFIQQLYVSHARRDQERTLCGIKIGQWRNGWTVGNPGEFVYCQRCRRILDRESAGTGEEG